MVTPQVEGRAREGERAKIRASIIIVTKSHLSPSPSSSLSSTRPSLNILQNVNGCSNQSSNRRSLHAYHRHSSHAKTEERPPCTRSHVLPFQHRRAGAGKSAKRWLGSVDNHQSGGNVDRYGQCTSRQLKGMCLFDSLSLNSYALFTSTSSLPSELIVCLHCRIKSSYGVNAS